MNLTNPLALGIGATLLVGCSSLKPVLRTDGKEMLDIYRHALETDEQVDDALTRLDAEEKLAGTSDNDKEENKKSKKSKKSQKSKQRRRATRRLDGPDAAKNQYVMGPNGVPLRFQCGVGGRIQDKPCGSGYGFPKIIERKSKRKMKGAGIKPPSERELEMIKRVNRYAEDSARKAMPASAPQPKKKKTLYENFTATPNTTLKQLFPRLPNPDIIVYVTPHLATHNRVPIPGYTTALPLYDQVHYAMPGEDQGHE